MGKPYSSELAQLPHVYEWACQFDLKSITATVTALASKPLMVVGSGGSLTGAHFASYLHHHFAQRLARVVTPLEVASLPSLPESGALVLTAGGRNPDVIGALRLLAEREPRELVVLCAAERTPLSEVASAYEYVKLVEFSPPTGKDGFIATNTLLATSVLLTRAYQAIYTDRTPLPAALPDLLGSERPFSESLLAPAARDPESVLTRSHLLVLFGPAAQAAATDIESKFSETALGAVQLSDFRNFAHGRHHWLSARPHDIGVLAIVTDEDEGLAQRTLALLPENVPAMTLRIRASGAQAALAAIVGAFYLVGVAGEIRGIDPGRPSVAEFGRRLYHLNAFGRNMTTVRKRCPRIAAIERKSGVSVERLRQAGSFEIWDRTLNAVLTKLTSAKFRAIVFDYDGTLCPPRARFHGIERVITERLRDLLEHGILIGIATGRGKSVRKDLREKLLEKFWGQVWIGYYNAGQIGTLSDDSVPDKGAPVPANLEQTMTLLRTDEKLWGLIDVELGGSQITVFPKAFSETEVWELLQQLCSVQKQALVRSTHSVDILATGVSKLNLVEKIAEELSRSGGGEILRIGDLGRWPGNDHQLLAHEYGLSVDQVSLDPKTCWNLAPAGHRGTQATLDYVRALDLRDSYAYLNPLKLSIEESS
jgi:fructoselysine-6-P-deglycase FrlB-like protein